MQLLEPSEPARAWKAVGLCVVVAARAPGRRAAGAGRCAGSRPGRWPSPRLALAPAGGRARRRVPAARPVGRAGVRRRPRLRLAARRARALPGARRVDAGRARRGRDGARRRRRRRSRFWPRARATRLPDRRPDPARGARRRCRPSCSTSRASSSAARSSPAGARLPAAGEAAPARLPAAAAAVAAVAPSWRSSPPRRSTAASPGGTTRPGRSRRPARRRRASRGTTTTGRSTGRATGASCCACRRAGPAYWKARNLDVFDGRRWLAGPAPAPARRGLRAAARQPGAA